MLFDDIAGHWAQAAIEALAKQNLIMGDGTDQFRPAAPINRAEMAALISRVFPDSEAIREPLIYKDVPNDHWAASVIAWATERGYFYGYSDQTFRPERSIPRMDAFVAISAGLGLDLAPLPLDPLPLAYADADQIPAYARAAITACTLAKLVVNVPMLRWLRPKQAATRAEIVCSLSQALGFELAVDFHYVAWRFQLRDLYQAEPIAIANLGQHDSLVRELQAWFQELRLYPGHCVIDGAFGPLTQAALGAFCKARYCPAVEHGVQHFWVMVSN